MDIKRCFTPDTHRALTASNQDYVSKDTDELALIKQLKQENNLGKVYRFDIRQHGLDG